MQKWRLRVQMRVDSGAFPLHGWRHREHDLAGCWLLSQVGGGCSSRHVLQLPARTTQEEPPCARQLSACLPLLLKRWCDLQVNLRQKSVCKVKIC